MDRKAMARETLEIIKNGYYDAGGKRVDIQALQDDSVKNSFLLTPEQGDEVLKQCLAEEFTVCCTKEEKAVCTEEQTKIFAEEINAKTVCAEKVKEKMLVWNCSTVEAILRLHAQGIEVGVLNFASAKNPGGGFINGANAQEESLAVSSGLYRTLTVHETYYSKNRECKSMMYTNHAIYSPNVVFFRDERSRLMEEPVTASVLTIPAVNMGQVLLKGEDPEKAKQVMRERMKLILSIFARQNCKHLVLGAYGCGVFRNDPIDIARWWKELLEKYFYERFETVVFAVLDRSINGKCIRAFEDEFLQ